MRAKSLVVADGVHRVSPSSRVFVFFFFFLSLSVSGQTCDCVISIVFWIVHFEKVTPTLLL